MKRARTTIGLIGLLLGSTIGLGPVPTAGATQAAPADFRPLSTFDNYVNGSLRTQGTWSVNVPGGADGAVVSADVPGSFSGKAMVNQLSGLPTPVKYRGNAYAGLGNLSIADGQAGTVFWEFSTTNLAKTGLNLGLSADSSPGLGADTTGDDYDLADFGPQITFDSRGIIARDGATDRVIDNVPVANNTIYRIWLSVDNAADTYTVTVAAPGQAPQTGTAAGRSTFAFRAPVAAPLITFLQLNDAVTIPTADSYLDNIYLAPIAGLRDDPTPAYTERTDFNNYNLGTLNGQQGWTASTGTVVTTDPTNASNKVVQLAGNNLTARKPITQIEKGSTGTLFFRFHRVGNVDTSLGLTDVDNASTFNDMRVQANNQNSSVLNVRNGGAFTPVGEWSPSVWQCVWLVADHQTNKVEMYSRGGPYASLTRLPVDQNLQYDFRTATAGALDRFFVLNGTASTGTLRIDDVAVDSSHRNFRIPSGNSSDCSVAAEVERPVVNPVPQTPQASDLTLTIEPVAQVPPTQGSARINFVSEIPGSPGRLAVPDLQGPVYVVENGRPQVYVDPSVVFPHFVRSPSLGTGTGFVAFHPEFATNGLFYTVHTEAGAALTSQTPTLNSPANAQVHGVITEWHATDPKAPTFNGTHRQVLRIGYSQFLHGLQEIGFNPHAKPGSADYGLLYIGSGDGDEVPVFTGRPQDLGAPQGKVLRIDPRGTNGPGGSYGIPAANPFVGTAGALGEVYAYGMRNPHRFSWDAADGRMFLAMIAEKSIDGIYELRAGDNLGWNEREGAFRFDKNDPNNVYPLPKNDASLGYTYPVLQLGRNTGISLVGGFVYRGSALPALQGKYLFGDIISGDVRYTEAAGLIRGASQPPFYNLKLADTAGRPTTIRGTNARADLRFGQDAKGELYLTSKADGRIWKITGVSGAPVAPTCGPGTTVVENVSAAADWAPQTPSLWEFSNGQIIQTKVGNEPTGPRRPYEFAVLTAGQEFTSLSYRSQVRIDEPVSVSNRDVILVFNYQTPTKYSYVHLSQDNTIYPHNGIFVVNDADRLRIDDQWNPSTSRGAAPAIKDREWHDVRIDFCADTGSIKVYVDGSSQPLMTATDRTFTQGRVGFGSFDNYGRVRAVKVTGTSVKTEPVQRFSDVPVGAQFFTEIDWLANSGATTGYPDGKFLPADSVSRQALIAFVHRLANPGATKPVCTVKPFTDVEISSAFCGEIAWAKSQQISTGFPDGSFHPGRGVQRDATMAFLYRLGHPVGSAPAACTAKPFRDVGTAGQFCAEIAWAKGIGLTDGFTDGTFRPSGPVSRSTVAAFLYRINHP
ncbi:hypothetical protein D1871_18615 [Nakamurella silvestris]|nr:hypothetical protein D1871_18615 [Nakamurella silvestris]